MKTNNTFTSLLFLILCSSLWSSCECTQTVFSHSGAKHLPLKEKNDFQIATDFYSVQIGYSPIKHLGIQGSYFNENKKDNHFENGILYFCSKENRIADIAVGGYYSFLQKNKNTNANILLSGYLGYGQGTLNRDFMDKSGYQFALSNFSQQASVQYLATRFQLGYFLKREVNDLKEGSFIFGDNPNDGARTFIAIVDSDLEVYYSSTLKAAFDLDLIWLFSNITWNHRNESFNFYPNRIIQGGFALDINKFYKKIRSRK